MPGPASTKWQFHSWARVATTPVRGQSCIAWDSTGWGGRWTPEGTCACGSLGQVVPQISKATLFWKVKLSILECLSSAQHTSTARTGRERVPAAQTWLLQENQVSCSFTGCFHSQGAPIPQRNRFIVLHLIFIADNNTPTRAYEEAVQKTHQQQRREPYPCLSPHQHLCSRYCSQQNSSEEGGSHKRKAAREERDMLRPSLSHRKASL